MPVFDFIRGRNDSLHVHDISTAETNDPKTEGDIPPTDTPAARGDISGDNGNVESERDSLEARNEKEIMQHPNEVTSDAQMGLKKVEAAALVWSKKSVYTTYAW